jgi:hypothetical protein
LALEHFLYIGCHWRNWIFFHFCGCNLAIEVSISGVCFFDWCQLMRSSIVQRLFLRVFIQSGGITAKLWRLYLIIPGNKPYWHFLQRNADNGKRGWYYNF